jgi:hypothetical protein
VAIAIAIGLIVWLVVGRDSSNNSTANNSTVTSTTSTNPSTAQAGAVQYIGPVVKSQKEIADYSQKIGQPIYWAGPQKGFTYELTRTADGRAYVRYLPKGAKAGAPGGDYTVVVTYPFNDSYKVLKSVSRNDWVKVPGGGIAAVANNYPKSVRLSFPGVNYQIEVYTPSPARSIALALSGKVKPVS